MLFLYIWFRWARLTTRTHGVLALAVQSFRKGAHAGIGRGVRNNPYGRAHRRLSDSSYRAPALVAMLQAERLVLASV
jgi:hypothetical protein